MPEEVGVEHSIVLGQHVEIGMSDSDVYRIGDCELPKDIVFFGEGRQLRFRKGWCVSTQLDIPEGKSGLHYPIYSTDPKEKRKFFIQLDLIFSVKLK